MKIIYHGHSFVQLESKKYSILIDPFVTGNPTAITNIDNLKCDFIILTHGHGDHISDAITIAQKYKATIISSFEKGFGKTFIALKCCSSITTVSIE